MENGRSRKGKNQTFNMPGYTINEISVAVQGRIHGSGAYVIDHIVSDTRKIVDPVRSLFFALPGEHRDGHKYIPEAFQQGVLCFMVQDVSSMSSCPGSVFIQVKNTLEALQQLAGFHRQKFKYPVIGITGSNGKTIVKEWLYHLLEKQMQVVRSPRSYNSQIGVPLSVWQMNDHADLAIFEAGISTVGEMEKLEQIIRPDIGIFTNIGDAHSEGFSSRSQKIREKLKLFIGTRVLIYCNDQQDLDNEIMEFADEHGIALLSWGINEGADIRLSKSEQRDGNTFIRYSYKGVDSDFEFPFTGTIPVDNVMTCVAVLLYLGKQGVTGRMRDLPSLSMRLEMKHGINGCTVINDSYSADISSLKLALDFLRQQHQHERRTVILSDLLQTGKPDQLLCTEIATLLQQFEITKFVGIGTMVSKYAEAFRNACPETEFYSSTSSFLLSFHQSMFQHETILVKGARSFGFEQIDQLLEIKWHQTMLSVNLTAISHNLKVYRGMMQKGTRIMVMVKAFSYGSGGYEIANLLQFHKVDHLAVAYADEGVDLRKAGINLPVMVMNPEEATFLSLVNYDLQPEIFSFGILQRFHQFLQKEGITEYPIHLKLDTGMHRLGFSTDEVHLLMEQWDNYPEMRIISVFTHLVSSEDPDEDDYTRQQAGDFQEACELLGNRLGYSFSRHISNTAAINRHPELQLDMVRLGIGLYGVDTTGSSKLQLMEAAVLTSTVAQVKHVKAGDTVGYNRKGRVNRDSIIATIRIGYADGYPRSLGNGRGKMMIRNQYFPVIGNVCMDMTMVDVTDMPGITEGEEVVIFGRGLSLNELAAWAGTIPYDIMTGISQRVKRIYYED